MIFHKIIKFYEQPYTDDLIKRAITKGIDSDDLRNILKPDKTIDEVDPGGYDLLIIPGGAPNGAPATVRKIKKAQEIARSFVAKNKPIASICHGVELANPRADV